MVVMVKRELYRANFVDLWVWSGIYKTEFEPGQASECAYCLLWPIKFHGRSFKWLSSLVEVSYKLAGFAKAWARGSIRVLGLCTILQARPFSRVCVPVPALAEEETEFEEAEPDGGGISTNELEKVGPKEGLLLFSLSDPRRRRTVWNNGGTHSY